MKMKTLPSRSKDTPQTRVRHRVGFKYLEALQRKVLRESSSTTSLLDDEGGLGGLSLLPSTNGVRNGNGVKSGRGNNEKAKEKPLDLLVLGVCEGTNMSEMGDVDFVLCRFRQEDAEGVVEIEVLGYDTIHVPPPNLTSPNLNQEIGNLFSTAIHLFSNKHSFPLDTLDLIGLGGFLLPPSPSPSHEASPKAQPPSARLGEGATIAAKTGVTTVSDFRATEQAIGRPGTNLFCFLTGLVLCSTSSEKGERRKLQVCIEIGDISSVVFVPRTREGSGGGGIEGLYEWDIGPGTHLLTSTLLALGYDIQTPHRFEGEGEICHEVVEELLEHDTYLKSRPPKTVSKEAYGDDMARRILTMCRFRGCNDADTLATVTRFLSASIAQQLLLFGPGRHLLNHSEITLDFSPPAPSLSNLHLHNSERFEHHPYTQIQTDLRLEFPGAVFHDWEQRTGIPSGNGKKRIGCAMLAVEALLGRAVVVPVNAAVRRPNTVTGTLAPGVRWREICG
ncbi:hypothetical protein HYFRA_00012242, partial [Hymenoscyphus fraxineus]